MKQAILLLAIFTAASLTDATFAATPNMESSRYRIEWGNINMGANDQTSSSYDLSTTLGQLAAGRFSSDGYIVRAGFQYIHSIIPFRFTVSNTNINFGELLPNSPVTATTNLTVSFGSAGEYQVTAAEQGPMQTLAGSTIPDTTCDNGCTETLARPWTATSSYGFGYNMSGQDIPEDFSDSSYYRPFPDENADETPAIVMTHEDVSESREATMTFKINTSGLQSAGSYQTIINYVATPSF